MTAPGAWPAVLLAGAAYRVYRLLALDEWPPVAKARAWLIGEEWVPGDTPSLPGNQPSSEVPTVRPAYRRPLLAHLVHCPWCLGAYTVAAWYAAWALEPRVTLLAAAPFAIATAVGVVSHHLSS